MVVEAGDGGVGGDGGGEGKVTGAGGDGIGGMGFGIGLGTGIATATAIGVGVGVGMGVVATRVQRKTTIDSRTFNIILSCSNGMTVTDLVVQPLVFISDLIFPYIDGIYDHPSPQWTVC